MKQLARAIEAREHSGHAELQLRCNLLDRVAEQHLQQQRLPVEQFEFEDGTAHGVVPLRLGGLRIEPATLGVGFDEEPAASPHCRVPIAQHVAHLAEHQPCFQEALLAGQGSEEILPGLDALARRSAALSGTVRELQRRLQSTATEILPSYVHMFVNRLSRSAGPEHELVLYDFLVQIYSSLLARSRKLNRVQAAAAAGAG